MNHKSQIESIEKASFRHCEPQRGEAISDGDCFVAPLRGAPRNDKIGVSQRSQITGFSLVELIIAISLMGLIILAIVAVDVGSRGFLKTSDDESTLQNEANFVMETMAKDISMSYWGNKNNRSIEVSSGKDTLFVRLIGSGASFDYSNSKWVRYQFADATIKKQVCEGTLNISSDGKCNSWTSIPQQQLVKNIIKDCAFNFDPDTAVVGITITARTKPSENPGQDNPEVILETSAFSRSISR